MFIDECGINTKMTRLYGRSLSSERYIRLCSRADIGTPIAEEQAIERKTYVPRGHWHTNTFIAALRHDRIHAPILFDGPMSADTFLQYIQQILAPTLTRVPQLLGEFCW